jgi:hypothetical protein
MIASQLTSNFPYEEHTIYLLNNVKIDATGDLTGAVALSEKDRAFIFGSTAVADGLCVLDLSATGVSGSGTPAPSVKITGVWASPDGTNYFKWQDTADPVLSGTGVTGSTECTTKFTPSNMFLKLGQDTVTATASDFIYITAKIICYIPRR